MGQYYKAILLKEDKKTPIGFATAHDFGNGVKLMEHSYVRNCYVGFVESLLLGNPTPVVWAGDYADNEPVGNIPEKTLKEIAKGYECSVEELSEHNINLYDVCNYGRVAKLTHNQYIPRDKSAWDFDFSKVMPNLTESRYVVNHDTQQFVDKRNIPEIKDWEGARIHPLPLLTCEGNNRGGGDFRGDEKGLVGAWARNLISIESKKPKGYTELVFDVAE